MQGRAFYIAGMLCCDTIVEKRERNALMQKLIAGPLSFVELYSSLAESGMRVRLPG